MAKQEKGSGLQPLKEDLKSGQIANLYVFHGEEKYLLEHYLGLLRSKLVDPAMEQFNNIVFNGAELSIERLADAVEGLPVFSEHRLVTVRDFDIYQAPVSQRADLEDLVSDIPEGTCLVFIYDTLDFKPDQRSKIHKAVLKAGKIIEFPMQETGDLISWLKRRFKAVNKTIVTAEAEYMLLVCGKLMQPLTMEVEKVAAFSKSDRIVRSDIDAVCYPVLDAVIYKMTDAVFEQRYDDAVKLLRDLIAMKNDPIMLLSALGKQLRNLLYTNMIMKSGDPEIFLRDKLKIGYGFLIKKMISNAGKLPAEWCVKAVQLCAECDYRMKRSLDDKEEILDFLLMRLSQMRAEM